MTRKFGLLSISIEVSNICLEFIDLLTCTFRLVVCVGK